MKGYYVNGSTPEKQPSSSATNADLPFFSSSKASTSLGGKASLQPKRTPMSKEEIEAILVLHRRNNLHLQQPMQIYPSLQVQKLQHHLEGRPRFNPKELLCPKRRLRQFCWAAASN